MTTEPPWEDSLDAALRGLTADEEGERDAAWRTVHDAFSPSLRALVISWGVSSADGDEAILETWTRVFFASRGKGVPTKASAFAKYLRQVCRNYLADRIREAERHPTDLLIEDEDRQTKMALLNEAVSAISRASDPPSEEELGALRRAVIERLSPPDAALYQLLVEGRAPGEIAAQFGISRSAMDVRIFRLRERLSRFAEALLLYRAYRGDDR